MAKTKKQVTLNNETIKALEKEGLGSLSTGIEFVYREWMQSKLAPAHHKPAKAPTFGHTLDLPQEGDDEPQKPKVDMRSASRIAREAAEKAAKEKEAYEGPRREYRARVRHGITHEKPLPYFDELEQMFDGIIPADERKQIKHALLMDDDVLVERDRVSAQFEKVKADMARDLKRQAEGTTPVAPKVKQTLMLSQASLKALGLFGTPVDMPDDKIKEYNDYYLANPPRESDEFSA